MHHIFATIAKRKRCHSEWSEAESGNLRTNGLFGSHFVPRSFDSPCSLRMTAFSIFVSIVLKKDSAFNPSNIPLAFPGDGSPLSDTGWAWCRYASETGG